MRNRKFESGDHRWFALVPVLATILCALCAFASPDDTVQPQTLDGVKLYRDVGPVLFTTNITYTQGAPLRLTNVVCYSTANLGTNSVVQGLDVVTVEAAFSASASTTGSWRTATVTSTNLGKWTFSLTNLPTVSVIYWQCRITDSQTNRYYYQQQMLQANPHL